MCIWHLPHTRYLLYTTSHTPLKKRSNNESIFSNKTEKEPLQIIFHSTKMMKYLQDLHTGVREFPAYQISEQLHVPCMQSTPAPQSVDLLHTAPTSPSTRYVLELKETFNNAKNY